MVIDVLEGFGSLMVIDVLEEISVVIYVLKEEVEEVSLEEDSCDWDLTWAKAASLLTFFLMVEVLMTWSGSEYIYQIMFVIVIIIIITDN